MEFKDARSAQKLIEGMKGRIYDGREVEAHYVNEEIYYKHLHLS